MDTCAEDRSLIGRPAWEAEEVLCGQRGWRYRSSAGPLEECHIPVAEWKLEKHGALSDGVFWDIAYTNTHEQQEKLERTIHYIEGYWRLECICHDDWSKRSFTRALKKGVLLMDKKSRGSCYMALIRFAKLCAGCQCCKRHTQSRTADGCCEQPPSLEEDPCDTWGRECKCRCRNLFRDVNRLFKDRNTEEELYDYESRY
jgi:hypothetical protein